MSFKVLIGAAQIGLSITADGASNSQRQHGQIRRRVDNQLQISSWLEAEISYDVCASGPSGTVQRRRNEVGTGKNGNTFQTCKKPGSCLIISFWCRYDSFLLSNGIWYKKIGKTPEEWPPLTGLWRQSGFAVDAISFKLFCWPPSAPLYANEVLMNETIVSLPLTHDRYPPTRA